jgi:two-component system phosphate regulon response regulator PhoB
MISKTILIIDDDETMKEGLNVLFEDEGYTVYNLASGENIQSWLTHHDPDLIIVDYLMPGPNGAEITRELRRTKKSEHLPIIMMAATSSYSVDGYSAGINTFLTKPFEMNELLHTVRHFLGS